MKARVGILTVLAALAAVLPAWAKDLQVRVIVPSAGMLRSADYGGDVIRKAAAGDKFVAVTSVKDNEFYLVQDDSSGSFLYLAARDVEVLGEAPTKKVLVSGQMPMPTQQDLSYWQVMPSTKYEGGFESDWHGSTTRLRSQSSKGYNTAPNGKKYPAGYAQNAGYRPRVNGRKLVADAKKFLNTPYVLGGTTTKGIDCSGLTQVCLANQGIELVHRSSLQALEGQYVHHDSLQPGDLVYFRDKREERYLSHVGIYVGSGKFIHASQGSGKVTITSLSDKYFKAHYAFARRL